MSEPSSLKLHAARHEKFVIKGKFLYKNNLKFYIKGVTYRTFKLDENNNQFSEQSAEEMDFYFLNIYNKDFLKTYSNCNLLEDNVERIWFGISLYNKSGGPYISLN